MYDWIHNSIRKFGKLESRACHFDYECEYQGSAMMKTEQKKSSTVTSRP